MRTLDGLSGPWRGLSTQDGLRISEDIHLIIGGGRLTGHGTDQDGNFDLDGSYDEESGEVLILRTYSYTTEPSQQGVGIPYDYIGEWDGAMIAGIWRARFATWVRGPFEMWPKRDEEQLEIGIKSEERETVAPA